MYSTTKISVVRPFQSLVRTKLALSKKGRFLSKAEILGVGVSSPLSILKPSHEVGRDRPDFLGQIRGEISGGGGKMF